MFNLFKKSPIETKTSVSNILKQSPKEIATIEEIHNSFDIAADMALEEANKILSINKMDENQKSHAIKLLEAGFFASGKVAELQQEQYEKTIQSQRAETILKYKNKYPNIKFIFADQVENICKKYNLVFAPINRYKGDVPEKNLNEILRFELNEEDNYKECQRHTHRYKENGIEHTHRFGGSSSGSLGSYDSVSRYFSLRNHQIRPINESVENDEDFYISAFPKFICAPASDIVTYGNEKIENGKLVSVPDPIVLHVVKEGFLVVSKWGIEGNDQELLTDPTVN